MMMRPDELQAFDWIRKNTRPESLFQVDPIVRAVDSWRIAGLRRAPQRSACGSQWCGREVSTGSEATI
jgi:hypothetical protein